MPRAVPSHHDDHHVGAARVTAHCLRLWRRRRSPPDAWTCRCRRPVVFPADHALSDARGVHVHGGAFRVEDRKETAGGRYGNAGGDGTLESSDFRFPRNPLLPLTFSSQSADTATVLVCEHSTYLQIRMRLPS